MMASSDPLFQLLQPSRLTSIVDVGASPIDGDPPYKAMLEKGLCTVVGFEPQQDALAALNQRKGPLETYFPHVLGDGQAHTLHICAAPGMTSLLKPDANMLSLFRLFPEFGRVSATEPVTTRLLDDVVEVGNPDFLKIDVQGSELTVFRSGRKRLSEAVFVQTEVSFLPLYENQPLFGEIDQELRLHGLIPHTFAAIKRWAIAPLLVNNDPYQGLNQLLEADVVYVRDFTRPQILTDEQLKHLALIAHHCYRSYDLVLRCVMVLEQRGSLKKGSQQRYGSLIGRPSS
jgi:FkbM family methyltransferase